CHPSSPRIAARVTSFSLESRPSVAIGSTDVFIGFENCNRTCRRPGSIPGKRVSTVSCLKPLLSGDEIQRTEYTSLEKEPSGPGVQAVTDFRIGGPAAELKSCCAPAQVS